MPVKYSVLVVTPEDGTQNEINSILRKNFDIEQVLTAQNHECAEQELENNESIQCIIVNSHLDDGNGFDFISRVKQDENFKDVKTLIISESSDRETLLQAAASGADELLRKPLSSRSVALKLKRIFNVKQFRITERISLMGALSTDIKFDSGQHIQGSVIDISTGGCSISAPRFTENGVYDICTLYFEFEGNTLEIPAELIRIERDYESQEMVDKKLLCGFQIKDLNADENEKLIQFLSLLSEIKP